ncbi:MAG: spore maturation protein [Clostridia bacterium]|nr:spore maturation protein [Clostridia bacterium]MDD4048864.1 spore maturation protein [Clostridia bacterium]
MTKIIYELSRWAIPSILFFVLFYATLRGVKVYDCFIKGAEEGFGLAIKIIPYLVAMMIAVSIFRQAGVINLIYKYFGTVFSYFNIPPDILPLAIMRPFSGGAALGISTDLINTYGADSYIGRLASTMQGSTDTTFFVLTVYFGSVGISKYRYSLGVGLLADLTTFIASIYIVSRVFL